MCLNLCPFLYVHIYVFWWHVRVRNVVGINPSSVWCIKLCHLSFTFVFVSLIKVLNFYLVKAIFFYGSFWYTTINIDI